MLLAGDVGGTKTLLGLFERAHGRPQRLAVHAYLTRDFTSFGELLDAFARDVNTPFAARTPLRTRRRRGPRIAAAVVGVAGPVVGGTARLTNVQWSVSAADIAARFHTPRVRILNDLEAMALGAGVLGPEEVIQLQRGVAREDGNAVIIAAGTGLGEAYLHRVHGRLRSMASEGGHADFAARTDREIELVRMLRRLYGRAEVEHVLSGPGLLNLHRFTHDGQDCPEIRGLDRIDAPAAVSRAALHGSCPACVEALSLFVEAYGAEAGNLALRGVATSGVFVGGGIAPQILPALQDGRFMKAFCAKGAMSALTATMPVNVILIPEVGLLGAAVAAQDQVEK
ncbi:MAG: glucokinase [Acidobacteria bacterium]|nr:glucokinase [Acidobacteriota bacterium]